MLLDEGQSKITPPKYGRSNDSFNSDSVTAWKLISQGAEARVWYVPSFISSSVVIKNGNAEKHENAMSISFLPAICKERFPKKYRHATLDASILRSRTKAEVKCLVRCRRGGVPCPAILACDMGPKNYSIANSKTTNESKEANQQISMCLFLEFIPGMTVREFFDQTIIMNSPKVNNSEENFTSDDENSLSIEGGSPPQKKLKNQEAGKMTIQNDEHSSGSFDEETNKSLMQVAYAIGTVIAKMHNVNVVHGDLTTSNIMLRNPQISTSTCSESMKEFAPSWKPSLVLIDFGLAGTAGAKGVNHEEKAVDLYVLERALNSTHPSCSQWLQKEIFRAYKKHCSASDSVLQRLSQVRLRGRKRECFG